MIGFSLFALLWFNKIFAWNFALFSIQNWHSNRRIEWAKERKIFVQHIETPNFTHLKLSINSKCSTAMYDKCSAQHVDSLFFSIFEFFSIQADFHFHSNDSVDLTLRDMKKFWSIASVFIEMNMLVQMSLNLHEFLVQLCVPLQTPFIISRSRSLYHFLDISHSIK